MGPFEMVVAIVGIGAVASVMRAKYGHGGRHGRRGSAMMAPLMGQSHDAAEGRALADENAKLRDEMRGMKERIQVLERLATDDASDARRLDREIEKLRDSSATGSKRNGE